MGNFLSTTSRCLFIVYYSIVMFIRFVYVCICGKWRRRRLDDFRTRHDQFCLWYPGVGFHLGQDRSLERCEGRCAGSSSDLCEPHWFSAAFVVCLRPDPNRLNTAVFQPCLGGLTFVDDALTWLVWLGECDQLTINLINRKVLKWVSNQLVFLVI